MAAPCHPDGCSAVQLPCKLSMPCWENAACATAACCIAAQFAATTHLKHPALSI